MNRWLSVWIFRILSTSYSFLLVLDAPIVELLHELGRVGFALKVWRLLRTSWPFLFFDIVNFGDLIALYIGLSVAFVTSLRFREFGR